MTHLGSSDAPASPRSDAGEVLREAADLVEATTGTVHLLGEDGMLHLEALLGSMPPPVLEAIEVIPVGKGIAGLTVERAEPVDLCNLQTDTSGDVRPGARATLAQGSICVPVLDGDRAVGALGVAVPYAREFTADEVAGLQRVAERLRP